jgi:hypothetical protein
MNVSSLKVWKEEKAIINEYYEVLVCLLGVLAVMMMALKGNTS